jgi:hypothetical protein
MARATTRVAIAALCAAAVATAGCARGGSAGEELAEAVPPVEGTVACEEVFAEGKVVDRATFGEVCTRGDEMTVSRPVRLACGDDRVLTWNEFAWGYEGQAMTMLDASATSGDDALPFDEIIQCLQTGPASGSESAAAATP